MRANFCAVFAHELKNISLLSLIFWAYDQFTPAAASLPTIGLLDLQSGKL